MNSLLIDDIRTMPGATIARTSTEGKLYLAQGSWDILYIDHDLGEDTVSGYDIINWALETDRMPEKVYIVSQNPVGRANIERALDNAGYQFNYKTMVWEV